MTVKEFLEMDIVEIAMAHDSKKPVKEKTAKVEPKTTESKEVAEEDDRPGKYKGIGNPMQLRKMLKDEFGIIAEANQKAKDYVALLMEAEKNGKGKKDDKPIMNKPAADTGEKLTEETYDKNQTYTAEQLKAVTGRGLENICRKVFDIPREKIVPEGKTAASKELCIKAILAVQGGSASSTASKYEGKTARELYNICTKKRGLKVPTNKDVEFYTKVLEANDRDVKKAVELFKECVSKGIKIAKGLPFQEYEKALKDAEDPEEEDWDDTEEEFDEVEEETAEDDEEDWDL